MLMEAPAHDATGANPLDLLADLAVVAAAGGDDRARALRLRDAFARCFDVRCLELGRRVAGGDHAAVVAVRGDSVEVSTRSLRGTLLGHSLRGRGGRYALGEVPEALARAAEVRAARACGADVYQVLPASEDGAAYVALALKSADGARAAWLDDPAVSAALRRALAAATRPPPAMHPEDPSDRAGEGFRQVQERCIAEALAATRGRIYGPGGAAARLGLAPTTLQSKMKKLGIPRVAA
jgi:hypothetical protein